MPSFDIIVTTYDRLDYTRKTIGSLIASGAHGACERFIIVDNHSTVEGMESFLNDMSHYQKVFILRRPLNEGWAAAVNDALGLSQAEYVLLSNNDVQYTEGFWIHMFDAIKQNPSIGILAGWRHTAHGLVAGGVQNESFDEMDNVPAVCWLMPKKAMADVGMLNVHGPCATKGGNGEDTDYVMRMKWKGYLTGATKQDVCTHMDGY